MDIVPFCEEHLNPAAAIFIQHFEKLCQVVPVLPDAITGAYTRPHFRGQGVAPALLDAASRHYRDLGYERCSVDFESFKPEAAQFWMKYFIPVCLSVMRHPEALDLDV
jgi:GNAT superfamily N-acetyltransferase